MADGAGLAAQSSSLHLHPHVEGARRAGGHEGAKDGLPVALPGEVFDEVPPVDADHALSGVDPNPGGGRLPPSAAVRAAPLVDLARPGLGPGVLAPPLSLGVVLPLLAEGLLLQDLIGLGRARTHLQAVVVGIVRRAVAVLPGLGHVLQGAVLPLLVEGHVLLRRDARPPIVVEVVVFRPFGEGLLFAVDVDVVRVAVVAVEDGHGVGAKGAAPGRLGAAISGKVVHGAVGVVPLVASPLVILLPLLLLLLLSPGWTRGEGPSLS
mmetsp:Transcript_7356/g.20386  ORF Transcript_7356/g.20386 Transcript_7356/m.20386 type:complete len:265 (-) Transcript_7356:201-995(-)